MSTNLYLDVPGKGVCCKCGKRNGHTACFVLRQTPTSVTLTALTMGTTEFAFNVYADWAKETFVDDEDSGFRIDTHLRKLREFLFKNPNARFYGL